MTDLEQAWTRLQSIRELAFESRSEAAQKTGWRGSGAGTVRMELVDPATMLFHEQGTWNPSEGRPTTFTNIFRWTLMPEPGLRLEHLRFGPERPVYLFDLMSLGENVLASSDAHRCQNDCYTARMEFDEQSVRLTWTVQGPSKSETIAYTYR